MGPIPQISKFESCVLSTDILKLQASFERDSALDRCEMMNREKQDILQQKDQLLSELQQVSAQTADLKKQVNKVMSSQLGPRTFFKQLLSGNQKMRKK